MATSLKQAFRLDVYVGATLKGSDPSPVVLDADELGQACMAFAESHVADPVAQFRDYVLGNPTLNPLNTGIVAPGLNGSAFTVQSVKRLCQGVGGHLGEGATALVVPEKLGLGDRIAHIAVRTNNRMRCPDFAMLVSLKDLYSRYGLGDPRPWEMAYSESLLPLPLEAKGRRDEIAPSIESFLKDGAIQQIMSYWWAMERDGLPESVGYGMATAFSYQGSAKVLSHVILRPKDQLSRQTLRAYFKACGTSTRKLYALFNNETMFKLVLGCLEGL